MIACTVVFIVWLFRAYKNVDFVAPGARRYDSGWAIGAWFVPILNLFRPKQRGRDAFSGEMPEELRSTLTRHLEARAAEGPPMPMPPPNPADRMDEPSTEGIPWRPPPPPLGSGVPY